VGGWRGEFAFFFNERSEEYALEKAVHSLKKKNVSDISSSGGLIFLFP
jgi:hypothetical protein